MMVMNRVLVVLPNWVGETLFATPLLAALRKHRPGAFIATLGWPQCRAVLQHNPSVDELLDYDERGRHRRWGARWRLSRSLRAARFDTAFLLRPSLSRTWLAWWSGIPARVGFANAKSGWLLTHRAAPAPSAHKARSYAPLLEAAGLPSALASYEYHVSDEERREAAARLAADGRSSAAPVVVLHPGANWRHKRWAPERFAAVGDRLAQALGARIVVTGAAEDRPSAASIIGGMRHPAACLAGETTVRQLGALLEQAHLVISNDTGVLHIAAALQRPLVALYGPTSPALTGPLGDPRRMAVLHHPGCCPRIPCYAPDHPPHPGMDSITVEEVCAAAMQLLERADAS